jgi:hypothetical protein
MADGDSPLMFHESIQLYTLSVRYFMQGDWCREAKAHLASCIMMGAGIESMLTLHASLHFEEALATGKAPKLNGKTKPLLDWNLGNLLDVAQAAKWLPETFTVGYPNTGDTVPTDKIRKLRNLVHPGRHIRERGDRELTNREFTELEVLCMAIFQHLGSQVEPGLREAGGAGESLNLPSR